MAAKSTSASQPEASQNGKKNVKAEKPVANKQDADDEAEDEPVEKGAKGEAVKDMRNVTRYFEEQAERSVDADKIQKALKTLQEEAIAHKVAIARKQQIDRSNISKENTDLIVAELNVPKLVAEKALLDNNNDVRAALTQLITQ
ncbi:hypothetical protein K450DRAFT_61163 [Umbelopsis ramanniana AG]|uniref:Nascent polypeptide-associated complex subunit alpha-like UBA domain-containing protein n=1 Tax=Umbelopsis ramanniana AG TaxID=1314678 RepID=A0AAD5EA46_UMBRA|nr:uncharacterized protein K450DRAFT_61163 [Umbelopsis ramanniana AG]KAI8579469.1 hypothetical protein K450DRAFT_61163 [Umbelopsis ramanniana AG]